MSAPVLGFALDNTYGSLFIGGILMTALWGASMVQMHHYFYTHSSSDQWWIIVPVILICILDTVHQGIFVHMLYAYLISNFANLLFLDHFDAEGASLIVITAFLDLFVQLIFVMRIWHLSKRNYTLTGISVIFVLAHFAATMIFFALSAHFSSLTQFSTIFNAERAMNSVGFLTDTTVSGILAYLLYTSKTGFAKTDSTIGFLIIYFISSGFLMDVCSLAAIITSALLPKTYVFLTILLIYPKLYTTSVLALLNTRQRSRRNISYGTDGMNIRNSLWIQGTNNPTDSHNNSNLEFTAIEIKVEAETVVRRETLEIDISRARGSFAMHRDSSVSDLPCNGA